MRRSVITWETCACTAMVRGIDGAGLIEEIDGVGVAVTARTMPLADVGTTWTEPEVPGVRTVLTP
ncbi:hypothetical protein [Streptomyces sp. SID12488]|uniref:hypothetical protein n=1 Tax=Streptomyces sp. SID12488 TaxID=2706040 RepID=UPI0013DCC435|nr:hypothetical protein [Streptomyces sp. SID12488]NEA64624.1 hypothetical protein [Streptomyces sp. SID12488]